MKDEYKYICLCPIEKLEEIDNIFINKKTNQKLFICPGCGKGKSKESFINDNIRAEKRIIKQYKKYKSLYERILRKQN